MNSGPPPCWTLPLARILTNQNLVKVSPGPRFLNKQTNHPSLCQPHLLPSPLAPPQPIECGLWRPILAQWGTTLSSTPHVHPLSHLLGLWTRFGVAREPRPLLSVLSWTKGSEIHPKNLCQFEDGSASMAPGPPPLHTSNGGRLRPSTAWAAGSGAGLRVRRQSRVVLPAAVSPVKWAGTRAGGVGAGRRGGGTASSPSPPFSSPPSLRSP